MKAICYTALFIVILIGCSDSAVTPVSTHTSEYYPLQVGNEWKYVETRYYDTIGIYKVSVVSEEVINGKTFYKVVDSAKIAEKTRGVRYERIENEKMYYTRSNDGEEILDIDFVNQDQSIGSFYGTLDKVEYKVDTFYNVKQINWLKADYSCFNQYAPNVGMIYSESMGYRKELIYAKIGDKIYQ